MKRMIAAAALAAIGLLSLGGCANTAGAFKQAQAREDADQRLVDTAYVVVELYAANVHEAADLFESTSTSASEKAILKAAAVKSAPFVIGDPATDPPTPSISELVAKFLAVKNAETREALNAAITGALTSIKGLTEAVKRAAGGGGTADNRTLLTGGLATVEG